jgi:hypothetical protein
LFDEDRPDALLACVGTVIDKARSDLQKTIDDLSQKVDVEVNAKISNLGAILALFCSPSSAVLDWPFWVHYRLISAHFSRLGIADTDVNARLSELKDLVEVKVSKSIDEMTVKMDVMSARIQQASPVPTHKNTRTRVPRWAASRHRTARPQRPPPATH